MNSLNIAEREAIQKYFGTSIEELDAEQFEQILKQIRKKYHPDNFAKFEDETVQEMATERFQQIEALATKMRAHFNPQQTSVGHAASDFQHHNARFAANRLKIEIRTPDKALKYDLFGKRNYRWLLYGETFKIPGTSTSIVMDENHYGSRIGYQETIRMYLTFGEEQATEDVANWIYEKIVDRADTLLVGGQKVPIDRITILLAIRRETFLGLGAAMTNDE
ncbi:MAG: hypothetical protein AAGI23_14815 [Bacteroidota bacterium]